MTFNDYQKLSVNTWLFNHNNDEIRAVLGLVGEAGEVAEKYKKFLRGDCNLNKEDIKKELGDILYYIARLCDYQKIDFNEVPESNLKKLQDRKNRKVLKGNGDNR